MLLAVRVLLAATLASLILSARSMPADQSWVVVLHHNLAFAYAWAGFALLIIAIDRPLTRPGVSSTRGLAWHVPISLAVVTASFYVVPWFETLLRAPGASFDLTLEPLRRALRWGVAWQLIIYWSILGAYRAVHYHSRYRERTLRAAELEASLTRSQLQVLRMQLEPHFLFNALNTISAHVESDPRLARRMLEELGELLRLSLESHAHQEVRLSEELCFLDRYLAIQRARFEERLRVDLEVAPETLEARVPSLLLQPLVENAIRHGLSHRTGGGTLRVAAEREGGELRITIADDGVGLPEAEAPDRTTGLGLTITQQRLERLYPGHRPRLEIHNGRNAGVVVEIAIPWHTDAEPRPVPRERDNAQPDGQPLRTDR
jgi:signal transduction histidine kinase